MLFDIVTLKWGLEITRGRPLIQTSTIRKLGCSFLFAFHSINYGSILHQSRDKARYWSKIVIFSHPLHSRPRYQGGSRRNIAIPSGTQRPPENLISKHTSL